MKDIDHKLSREIVNIAKTHDVSVIKLERLQNIRSTTR
ncbi:transposase, partial [Coprobacillus sp. AF17-11AC]